MNHTIVISLDFELGWGSIIDGKWYQREQKGVYERLRDDFYRILKRSLELDIPMTIGCVGAMVQKPSDWNFSHLPEDYRLAVEKFVTRAKKYTVQGEDLLEFIMNSNVKHEIASHTYSHLHAAHPSASDESLIAEIKKSITVFQSTSKKVSSLIFPRDQVFSDYVLSQSGISCVRIPPIANNKKWFLNYFRFLPSICRNGRWGGCELSGSLFLNWSKGKKAFFKKQLIQNKIKFLLSGRGTGSVYHLWFHPFNLSETKGFSDWCQKFMEQAASVRDRNILCFKTMNELCK